MWRNFTDDDVWCCLKFHALWMLNKTKDAGNVKNDGNEAIKFQKVHLTNLHDFYVITFVHIRWYD